MPRVMLPEKERPPLAVKPALVVRGAITVMGAVLRKVVGELTVRLLLPLLLPSTVFPIRAVLPVTERPWLATTTALAVMGPALAAKVVFAFTVSVLATQHW